MKGIFITFEGGEGSGKTTLVRKVYSALSEQGHEVVLTREPGGSLLGEKIRSLILHADASFHIASKSELFLFLASRVQHIEEFIIPNLNKGAIVLCDRFSDSTIAYQGAGRNLGIDYVTTCCNLATNDISPNLTLLVDIDPKLGLERTEKRRLKKNQDIHDRIEDENFEFHVTVREAFLQLAKRNFNRIAVLNGALPQPQVFFEAMKYIESCLKNPSAKNIPSFAGDEGG